MSIFRNAKWIWIEKESLPNSYGEFYKEFTNNGARTVCRISCDGDYTLFINGRFVESNQYGDYEWYKSYDEIDITPYVKNGKNVFAAIVWHFGTDTQRYQKAQAGFIFEIEEQGQVCVESGKDTLCRYSRAYKNGYKKTITPQLGYSFLYDAKKEDDWINGNLAEFHQSVVVDKACALIPRPIQKLQLLARKKGEVVAVNNKKLFVVDLGEETVGLPSLAFTSKTEQKILVSFGENLQGGRVRRMIGERDFSFEYIAQKGRNEYTNYMLRLGCRYMQLESEEEIELEYLTVLPQIYPVKENEFKAKNVLDKQIYDLCVNTLKLCMLEHYMDCPWREQCLYAFDSRNQMLCGYYAFEDKNAAYARANLLLMSKDRYPSGLMSICYPSGIDLTIPSFSLYYTLSVKEYVEHTGDVTLIKEVYPRIREYMDAFMQQRKDGLVYRFAGENNWNFYDWSNHLEGTLFGADKIIADAPINILFLMGLRCFKRICELSGMEYPYEEIDKEITSRTKKTFYDKEKKLFTVTENGGEYVELVNAIAVVYGLTDDTQSKYICEKLKNKELEPCSLSMKGFVYDALIKTDKEKYGKWILKDIRNTYKQMLDVGATATWETIEGSKAFENAGSLCHGWSALPLYYLNVLM